MEMDSETEMEVSKIFGQRNRAVPCLMAQKTGLYEQRLAIRIETLQAAVKYDLIRLK